MAMVMTIAIAMRSKPWLLNNYGSLHIAVFIASEGQLLQKQFLIHVKCIPFHHPD